MSFNLSNLDKLAASNAPKRPSKFGPAVKPRQKPRPAKPAPPPPPSQAAEPAAPAAHVPSGDPRPNAPAAPAAPAASHAAPPPAPSGPRAAPQRPAAAAAPSPAVAQGAVLPLLPLLPASKPRQGVDKEAASLPDLAAGGGAAAAKEAAGTGAVSEGGARAGAEGEGGALALVLGGEEVGGGAVVAAGRNRSAALRKITGADQKRKRANTAAEKERAAKKKKEGEGVVGNTGALTIRDIIRRSSASERTHPKDGRSKKTPAALPAPAAEAARSSALAPQVQVVDGRIVVNEASMTVNAAPPRDHSGYRRVVETGSRLNSATYATRITPEKWTTEDTELFYRALRQFGTDFTLIERLFPGRTRRQIKNKFKAEDSLNPKRVDAALSRKDGADSAEQYREMIAMLTSAVSQGGAGGGAGAAAAS